MFGILWGFFGKRVSVKKVRELLLQLLSVIIQLLFTFAMKKQLELRFDNLSRMGPGLSGFLDIEMNAIFYCRHFA